MRISSLCRVHENNQIAEDTYRMLISSSEIAKEAKPGQFIHVKVPNNDSLILRRPISISNTFSDNGGIVEIIYRVSGEGTKILSKVKSPEHVDVMGPLGNGFIKPKQINRAYVVGGGCGIAPLKLLVKDWQEVRFTSFLGFKDKSFAYDVDQFELLSEQVIVSTDDGSLGNIGKVTDFVSRKLKTETPDLIIGCGPVPMLKRLVLISEIFGIPCQISLEERMGCGIGACLVCVCQTKTGNTFGYKKVCFDGPVFWSDEVVLGKDEFES